MRGVHNNTLQGFSLGQFVLTALYTCRRAGINQQVLLRAEELQHDFLQNRGGVRPLKNVLNKTNYDGGDEESTCKSTSLQQNLSRQPVGDDDSVLGDFKSEVN